MLPGSGHEAAEERVMRCPRRELWVPLDPDSEGMQGVFDGFNQSLCVPGSDLPTGWGVFESFVVAGDHSEGLYAEERSKFRCVLDSDVVYCAVGVLLAARSILWEVLEEGGTLNHTEELHPVADTQDGDTTVDHKARQLEIEVLLWARGADGCRVRPSLSEPFRVEVVTSREHEGVDVI